MELRQVTLGLEGTDGSGGAGGLSEASWPGLSPREWADYTLSEVAVVSTALNNGIAARWVMVGGKLRFKRRRDEERCVRRVSWLSGRREEGRCVCLVSCVLCRVSCVVW